MLWLSFLMLLVIGVVMGISGIGGFLLPPLLLMIYEIALNEAILLGLGAQILIYAASFYFYRREGRVNFTVSGLLIAGSVPGVLLGFLASINLSRELLANILAAVLLLLTIFILFPGSLQQRLARFLSGEERAQGADELLSFQLIFLAGVGFTAGVMASLVGVGGPVITVPLLMAMGYKTRVSVGTSIFTGIFVVMTAFLFHLFYRQISFLLLLAVGFITAFGSAGGAAINDKIPAHYSQKAVLVATAVAIVYLLTAV